MIRLTAPRSTTTTRLLAGLTIGLGLLVLTACATPAGGVSSPEPTVSAVPPQQSPTPSASDPTPTQIPMPTESPAAELPYNGEVLVVTAEREGGELQVTAMIPGVAEDGGTCVLSLEGSSATATITGIAGNGVTYCGTMSVASAGGEQVRFRVTYTSTSTRAQSAVSTVESGQ